MRNLLIMMLLAAALPAWSHAQTVNICDRTPKVRQAILGEIDGEDCAAVDSAQLAGVESLGLSIIALTALAAGDFDGLTNLQVLALSGNQLAALPNGVFDGLTR